MKGHPIRYTADEMAWLEANRLLPIAVYHLDFIDTFGRDDVAAANLHSLRKRMGWKTGRTGCFEKGQAAHNKGKPCPPGKGGRHPNARKTQFKKGGRTGKANLVYKPIGTERITKDGYRERKVHDGLPMQSRWQQVHRIEWEAIKGPIPAGYCLKCLGHDKANCDPSNWELVPRALLPRLNGRFGRDYDTASPELKPTIMAIARLEHRARTMKAGR
jgi:hypothetical protein